MRQYGAVSPLFWTGKTGKKLRADRDAQVAALYLMTSPHSHQTGLYYLPIMYFAHESGLTLEGASEALRRLEEDGFCRYDANTEWIWVCEMAAWQIGTALSTTDKRCKGVQQHLESAPKSPLIGAFFERYHEDFHIPEIDSPSEGASMDLSSNRTRTEQDRTVPQSGTVNGHSTDLPTEAVSRVFEHWRTTHNHPKAQLDPKRRKVIREALKHYGESDLIASISGYKNSPYHMGKNELKTVYDGIELFLRDSKHIDAGLAFSKSESGKWM